MARKIYRIPPCPDYDVERLESWLQDMAKDGWMLDAKSSFLNILAFTKEAPQDIRYRLEPKPWGSAEDEKPSAEIQETCREYGWEFIRHFDHFFIYRAVTPDAREMNTDTAIQAVSLKVVRRQALLRFVYLLFLSGLSLHSIWEYPFWFLLTNGPLYTFGLLFFVLWSVAEVIVRAVHIHRLQRRLRNNVPLNHEKPWKKGAAFHLFSKIFLWVVFLLLLVYLIPSCTANLDDDIPLTAYGKTPPFVTLSALCPEAVYQSDPSSYYEDHSNLLAPVHLIWHEKASFLTADSEAAAGSLGITYVQTRSPRMAKGFANELIRRDQEIVNFQHLQTMELDADFAVMYNIVHDWTKLVIQHGNTVIQAEVELTGSSSETLLMKWAGMQLSRIKEVP